MKIREIILELTDPFDQTKYGAWINAKTKKIWYVKSHAHVFSLQKILNDNTITSYDSGYDAHLVRLVFDGSTLIVDGNSKDIKSIAPKFIAAALQPYINEILITKYTNHSRKESSFGLPEQRRDMTMFLKGETE